MLSTVNPSISLEDVYGLDVGRGRVQTITGTMKTFMFESYCCEGWEMKFKDLKPDHMVLKYLSGKHTKFIGKYYFVGELAYIQKGDDAKRMTNNKVNENTLIMALAALFQAGANGNTYICTGVPNKVYNEQADKLAEYLEGDHTIELNGVRRTITIKKCVVTIESGVYIVELRTGKRVRIVDPGAKTTNLVTIFRGQFVDEESDTINQGWETSGGGLKGVEAFAELIANRAGQLNWMESDEDIYVMGGRAEDILLPFQQEGFIHAKLPGELPKAKDMEGKEFTLNAGWVNAYCYLKALKGALGIAE